MEDGATPQAADGKTADGKTADETSAALDWLELLWGTPGREFGYSEEDGFWVKDRGETLTAESPAVLGEQLNSREDTGQ